MQITVQVKNVYGNELVYPSCDTSRLFASITHSKTLTPHVLGVISALGYSIKQAAPRGWETAETKPGECCGGHCHN